MKASTIKITTQEIRVTAERISNALSRIKSSGVIR